MLTLLSVDPGAISGWAVVSIEHNPVLLAYGSASIKLVSPTAVIIKHILSNQDFHNPERGVIEDQYLDKNVDSLKKLARSAGRWEEACTGSGMTVDYIQASSWQRSELAATGKTPRDQRKRMSIAKAYGVWGIKVSEHVADASLLGRYAAIRACYEIGTQRGRGSCNLVASDTT